MPGPGQLGVLIPIFGMMIGGFVVFARSELGKALAHRLRGGDGHDSDLAAEVRELRGEVDSLRVELLETQERLDFTERMIAGGRRDG